MLHKIIFDFKQNSVKLETTTTQRRRNSKNLVKIADFLTPCIRFRRRIGHTSEWICST